MTTTSVFSQPCEIVREAHLPAEPRQRPVRARGSDHLEAAADRSRDAFARLFLRTREQLSRQMYGDFLHGWHENDHASIDAISHAINREVAVLGRS